MTTREILQQAKALIDTPEKWGQGDEALLRGRACAGLAINRTGGFFLPQTSDAYKAVARAAGCSAEVNGLVRWNDAPERTHTDILMAFDRAIASLESPASSAPRTTGAIE